MVAKINLLSRLTPLLFVFAPFLAQSNMTVYPMAVSINSQGEGNVRVISKSNEVQYIKATVFRIDNPSIGRRIPGRQHKQNVFCLLQ